MHTYIVSPSLILWVRWNIRSLTQYRLWKNQIHPLPLKENELVLLCLMISAPYVGIHVVRTPASLSTVSLLIQLDAKSGYVHFNSSRVSSTVSSSILDSPPSPILLCAEVGSRKTASFQSSSNVSKWDWMKWPDTRWTFSHPFCINFIDTSTLFHTTYYTAMRARGPTHPQSRARD